MKYATTALLLLTGVVHGQEPQVLSLKSRIDLPNVNGRIDHFSADLKGRRLFMSALGSHTVEVLDMEQGSKPRQLKSWVIPTTCFMTSVRTGST
jgi:hypothetical protein